MVRAALMLGMLGGCNLVLNTPGFDKPTPLCGPFGPPQPVVFEPALVGATDFSVAADGIHGLVHATYDGVPGPTPIVLADGVWMHDVARYGSGKLAMDLSGAKSGVSGDAWGWIDHVKNPGLTDVVSYMLDGATWTVTRNNIASSNMFDLIVGNEVEADAGSGALTYYLVVIKQLFDGTGINTIQILAAVPPAYVFANSGFTDPLDTAPGLGATGGVLSGDHSILVYSAKTPDLPESHLYETKLARNLFLPGQMVRSVYAEGEADDQPWVNADCTQIWFRRGGVTLTAQKM